MTAPDGSGTRSVVLRAPRLFDGRHLRREMQVRLVGGHVASITPADPAEPSVIDLAERAGPSAILAPGFIDLQVNGGGGVLFNDAPCLEAMVAIRDAHRRFGTTTLLPTLITSPPEVLGRALAAAEEAVAKQVPGLGGLHLEGPFLNPVRRGVHDAASMRVPSQADLDLLTARAGAVRLVTLAPEITGTAAIARLAGSGIAVACGHTTATAAEVRAAFRAGAGGLTHLFNAMPPWAGREPGPLAAFLADRTAWAGVIADGHHVAWDSLRAMAAATAPGRLILVTDAMPPVGTDATEFVLDGRRIEVRGGRCVTADGTLAGAALDMAGAVRHTVHRWGPSLPEALRMASLYPARAVGLGGGRGTVRPGAVADLVLLDEQLRCCATWVAGAFQEV